MNQAYEHCRYVDMHCHCDLFPSPAQIGDEIARGRICTVAVTNAPFLFPYAVECAKKSSLILPALGLHPELIESHGHQISEFHRLLPQTRCIGEVGLDYVTRDEVNRAKQRKAFESIVRWCADSGDKILSVHSRKAVPDVLAIFGSDFAGQVILHWYSGGVRDLRAAIAAGFYFSVNLSMVCSERGQQIIREIPLDRILTESDGPFGKCDGLPATPASIPKALEMLASVLSKDVEELRVQVYHNAMRILE